MSALERKAIEHIWNIVLNLHAQSVNDENRKFVEQIAEARAWLEAMLSREKGEK